ncbi:FtsH protease activity modulator HflK [Aestuariibius insulae]|uniref:FtsH protease activity modulator HflK n=1 Tax=Aestuariibius insulae TaxID=2058287 RepID=UPI00345E21C5
MAGRGSGPWGGGSGNGGGDDRDGEDRRRPTGQGPRGDGPQIPEIDELMNRGREQLRVLMGGQGGGRGTGSGGDGPGGIGRGTIGLIALGAIALWAASSFYTVRPEERSVELFLGEFYSVGEPGLNFAPWPFITAEKLEVTREQTEEIGTGRTGGEAGFMLTGDENIVDIDFQVVWNITEPDRYLFNLSDPPQTIRAVSESAMREIIAQSELAPVLNRDRGAIADRLETLIQSTLDSYGSGVNIVRVNFDKADPPGAVIAAFRDVQNAEQERDQLRNEADRYANRVLAEARGNAAQTLEGAEAYRAREVNGAVGEANRFVAIAEEYAKAPEVTQRRLYLETIERVLGRVDKIILDEAASGGAGGQGVVPYLPLNELRRGGQTTTSEGSN